MQGNNSFGLYILEHPLTPAQINSGFHTLHIWLDLNAYYFYLKCIELVNTLINFDFCMYLQRKMLPIAVFATLVIATMASHTGGGGHFGGIYKGNFVFIIL